MPIDAQPGLIREIGTELQEERTEVGINRIHVEVIDHTRGLHNPQVSHTLGVTTLLRPEQHRLLLSPPDEQHPFLGGEIRQVLMHDVVFALTLDEVDPRHTLIASEAAHRRTEAVTDRRQRRGRGDRQPQLAVHEPHQPRRVPQLRHVHVEIHPIDALHLEHHMIGQDIRHTARYRHHGLRSDGDLKANHTATSGSYTGPARRSRSTSRRPEPTHPNQPRHASSGWDTIPLGMFEQWRGEHVQFPVHRYHAHPDGGVLYGQSE